jgi:DNA-directed RNA polymerase specialized sigma24 family protein
MEMLQATHTRHANEFEYATARDFCQIFDQDINSLYLLSLLLVGDHGKAEHCFVAALKNASSRRTVFRDWARSWARRSVIQSAQLMVNPRAHHADQALTARSVESSKNTVSERLEIAAVLGLESFDRFVFVMSVLEGYSVHECAILLGTTRREVTEARSRALQHLGREVEFRLCRRRVEGGSPAVADEKPAAEFGVVASSA